MLNYVVSIVGRPNVGKSTLFNRLLGYQKAIVSDESGVTRDRQYGESHWNGKSFSIIDTGGLVSNSEDIFEKEIAKQVLISIREADCILFIVDVSTGITQSDSNVAKILLKCKKRVLVIVNKVDNHERLLMASEFYGLGFEKVIPVSSISGSGTGEMLDEISSGINDVGEKEEDDMPRFAILGQPNVGKSSFVNALLGEERNIVSNIAGTTRDSISTKYNLFNKNFVLIDTAGIRKKKNMDNDLEYYSVIRAVKAIDECDVAMLLLDANILITHQDLSLFNMIYEKGKGVVILVNKWDIVANKETNTAKEIEAVIRKKIEPFSDVPIIFISALEKTRIFKSIETTLEVFENKKQKFITRDLNEFIKICMQNYQPPVFRGHTIKVKFITQLPTRALSFALFCNYPEGVKTPYKNYIENQLRKKYKLTGVPIRLFFRKNE